MKISAESRGFPSAREWCCIYQFQWPLCKRNCSFSCSMV